MSAPGPAPRPRRSHGAGTWRRADFAAFGEGSTLEADVLAFHPGSIEIGSGVYVGHLAILKGYHLNQMRLGDGCWIGEQTYLSSAGGLEVGRNVGIGIGVRVITSSHAEQGREVSILHSALQLARVTIGDDCDLGVGSIVLPGVRIGRGVQVGAGAVVTDDLPDYAVAAGVPARVIRLRPGGPRPGQESR